MLPDPHPARVLVLGVSLVLLASPAQARETVQFNAPTAYCELDVYTAYDKAVRRGWGFKCGNSTFVPEHAYRAISCQGKSPPAIPGGTHAIRGFFFKHPDTNQAGSGLRNGWHVIRDSVQVEGGNWDNWTGSSGAFDNRIEIAARITSPNTSFKRRLTSFKVKKTGGDCSKVYDEAF